MPPEQIGDRFGDWDGWGVWPDQQWPRPKAERLPPREKTGLWPSCLEFLPEPKMIVRSGFGLGFLGVI